MYMKSDSYIMTLTAITAIENKHPYKIANQNSQPKQKPTHKQKQTADSAFQTYWLTFTSIYSIISKLSAQDKNQVRQSLLVKHTVGLVLIA